MGEKDDESKLDVNSANFDPVLALYSDRVVIPRPDALVLDNVAKFEHLFNMGGHLPVRLDELFKKSQSRKKEKPEPGISAVVEPHVESTKETVSRKKIKSKPARNVLTRISNMSGPLAFLRNCMEKRIRVKVWTRNAAGIRGYCLGFVVAFDKHWNLALTDVREVWSRRVKRKAIPYVSDEGFEPPKQWRLLGPMVTPPKIVIQKTEKGMETCERHVNQMLMRGEHIAFISVTDA